MLRKIALVLALVAVLYGGVAYIVMPALWTHHEHQPALADKPMVTRGPGHIPGDPMNVGLVGDRDEILRARHAAGGYPADPITLRSSIKIVGSVLLGRPYPNAPVSPETYEGRREDMAYEIQVGRSARERHHVRFWKALEKGAEGKTVWLGSAIFDRRVGVSRYTGQVTHRIAADVDAERDFLIATLKEAGMISTVYQVSGVGPTLNGRNGEGDAYHTDGEVTVGVLREEAVSGNGGAPAILPSPVAVEVKNSIWRSLAGFLYPAEGK